jgi:hypothetical protein
LFRLYVTKNGLTNTLSNHGGTAWRSLCLQVPTMQRFLVALMRCQTKPAHHHWERITIGKMV